MSNDQIRNCQVIRQIKLQTSLNLLSAYSITPKNQVHILPQFSNKRQVPNQNQISKSKKAKQLPELSDFLVVPPRPQPPKQRPLPTPQQNPQNKLDINPNPVASDQFIHRRGKERVNPKPKKYTKLKKIILEEREKRYLEVNGEKQEGEISKENSKENNSVVEQKDEQKVEEKQEEEEDQVLEEEEEDSQDSESEDSSSGKKFP